MSWLAAGVASAGLNLNAVGQWWNRKEQRRQNQWGKDYADFSYYRERQDALNDRQHFEDYDSPVAQVRRMKQAGLNKALMYSQGTVGETEMPSNARANPSSQPAAEIDVSGMQHAMENFFTILQTQQNTDNLRAQAELAGKQAANVQSHTDLNRFDLNQKTLLSPNVLESSALALENQKADIALKNQAIELNFDKNEREELANSANVALTLVKIVSEKLSQGKTTAETAQIKEVIENINLEQKVKELDIELRKKGIMPHDPAYARYMQNLINGAVNTIPFIQNMMRYGKGGELPKVTPEQNKRFNEWNKSR